MSYVPTWMAYKRQLEILPPISTASKTFRGYRIPRPAVPPEGETPPGLICWGTVGDLPSAEPMPTVGFQVVKEHHTETSRVEAPVRIENPDDPSQYIIVLRASEVNFQKLTDGSYYKPPKQTNPGNTSAKPAPGITDYDPDRIKSFKPDNGGRQESTVKVSYLEGQSNSV